jgi:hypothetical protein
MVITLVSMAIRAMGLVIEVIKVISFPMVIAVILNSLKLTNQLVDIINLITIHIINKLNH